MKKVLAILMALMLLTASAALAENAELLQFSNIAFTHTAADGQTQTVHLDDLNAVFAIGAPDGVATIQLDVDDGTQALLGAVIQFMNGRMLLGIDGMQRPIAAPTQVAAMGVGMQDPSETLAQLFANPEALFDAKLSPFAGVTVPKVPLFDVVDMLSAFGLEMTVETDANGAKSAGFSVPAEVINQVLVYLPYMIPDENRAQLQPMLDQLSAMVENGGGFALEGRLFDDGENAEMLIDVLPVVNGAAASSAAYGLYFGSVENYDTLQLLVYNEGQSIPMVKIDLESDPGAASLYLTADLAGVVSFNFGLRPSEEIEGAQVAALNLTSQGQSVDASVTYGTQGDAQFVDFALNAPGGTAMSLHVDETPDGNGGKVGAMDARFQSALETVQVTSDIREQMGSYVFRAVENADNAYDAEHLGEIEQRLFQQDLNNALAPLINYLGSLQPAA